MSLYAGRKPELTDERREKIVAWYEENVAAMMAELEAWYPDKLVYPKSVKVHHGSFVVRASAVANELGYEGWPRLASAYGFDAGIGLVTKIDIGSDVDLIADGVWEKIADTYIPRINEWYPDGIVSDFRKSHPKTADKLVKLAKKFGYETCAELLVACGYDVRDSYSVKGGRPTSFDPEAVLAELKERFAEHPASSVDQVKDLCGDLPIKTFMNTCKSTYGVTFSQLLAQEGVLDGSANHRSGVSFSDEELIEAVRQLEVKYADSESRPSTLKDLIDLNPDLAPQLSAAQKESPRLFGSTFVKYLKSQSILAVPKARLAEFDDAVCEGIVDAMREKYLRAVRPNSLSELKKQNPKYVQAQSFVNAWIKRVYGQTPSEFFKAKELVSKVSRPDSILRPTEDEISAFYDEIGLDEARAAISTLPREDVVEFNSDVTGSEEYNTAQTYEMLRVGDVITFEIIDGPNVGVVFCGQKLGLINYVDRISRRLNRVVAYANVMGVVGGHIYAEVLEVTGGQKGPKALLKVFYGIDKASSNLVEGMLLSRDRKTRCAVSNGLLFDSRLSYRGISDNSDVVFVEQIPQIASSGRPAVEMVESNRSNIAAQYETLRRSCGLEEWPEILPLPPYERPEGDRHAFVSFETCLIPTGTNACCALRRGDVLKLQADGGGSVVALFCNQAVGHVEYAGVSLKHDPFACLPSPQLLSDEALAIDESDSFAFTNPETGAKTCYEFLFADDNSDENEIYYFGDCGLRGLQEKCSAGASPERRIRKSYFSDWLGHGDEGPSLVEMIESYGSHGGVGTPLAVVAGFDYEPTHGGVLDVVLQVRMAFEIEEA